MESLFSYLPILIISLISIAAWKRTYDLFYYMQRGYGLDALGLTWESSLVTSKKAKPGMKQLMKVMTYFHVVISLVALVIFIMNMTRLMEVK